MDSSILCFVNNTYFQDTEFVQLGCVCMIMNIKYGANAYIYIHYLKIENKMHLFQSSFLPDNTNKCKQFLLFICLCKYSFINNVITFARACNYNGMLQFLSRMFKKN